MPANMIVTIKFIAGQEFDLEVESDYSISLLKQLVSNHCDVPVEQQRLVFKGKILADGHSLCDYDIIGGTKLHLTVKKPERRSYGEEEERTRRRLWAELGEGLGRSYGEEEVGKILTELEKDLDRRAIRWSLDDIERLSRANNSSRGETVEKDCQRAKELTKAGGGASIKNPKT